MDSLKSLLASLEMLAGSVTRLISTLVLGYKIKKAMRRLS